MKPYNQGNVDFSAAFMPLSTPVVMPGANIMFSALRRAARFISI